MARKDQAVARVVDDLLVDRGKGTPYDRLLREERGAVLSPITEGGEGGGGSGGGGKELKPVKSDMVEGFERGGDCLPLQRCNEDEYVYVLSI